MKCGLGFALTRTPHPRFTSTRRASVGGWISGLGFQLNCFALFVFVFLAFGWHFKTPKTTKSKENMRIILESVTEVCLVKVSAHYTTVGSSISSFGLSCSNGSEPRSLLFSNAPSFCFIVRCRSGRSPRPSTATVSMVVFVELQRVRETRGEFSRRAVVILAWLSFHDEE